MKMKNRTTRPNNDDLLSELKRHQLLVERFINSNTIEDIDYDANFNSISKKNISDRDDAYTKLLNHFVNVTKIRNIIKEIHKWVYFWIIMILTVAFGISVCSMIMKFDISSADSVNGLVAIITAIIGFASVIISIPLIITKYLFSSKEDKRIADIILHTQKHDLDNKKILDKYNYENDITSEEDKNLQTLANVVTQTAQKEKSKSISENNMNNIKDPTKAS